MHSIKFYIFSAPRPPLTFSSPVLLRTDQTPVGQPGLVQPGAEVLGALDKLRLFWHPRVLLQLFAKILYEFVTMVGNLASLETCHSSWSSFFGRLLRLRFLTRSLLGLGRTLRLA